ncbi:DegT/DnrJ/EryC1/StrS family aminotransferase [Burkholderia sp. AU31624]|uniref:DegT/DnrJ/EryC1/StrS family aminotransferase n=1 Tax=unclassified Burkholderia TaxID=2613784 RepID=UPI0015C5928A|nr:MULTISPECIES: DegT/DnrJ/EryC1/StrS family aminotransferase [unclassified Burkholderia]MCA8257689.1 DegT/DnrJ/EryC1/StrS family aminotransferase [Burkholderia sp. AU31624]
MNVPFLDLGRLNAPYKAEFLGVASKLFDDGTFIGGGLVSQFEREFAEYCGTEHCVGVGNGLDAITLALKALGIAPGDEVIVPAQTFVATWLAVTHVGAVNVPVDVEPRTANLDPDLIEAAITPRTKAIIVVHLYGATADMARINEIAKRHGLYVIEDAAQAHGDIRFDRKVGTFGDIATFSFYPSKNLGAVGDAGCVVTNSSALAQRVRELGNYGSSVKYRHDSIGFNSRLDPIQAGFLSLKIKDLDRIIEKRRAIAARYDQAIGNADESAPVFRLLDFGLQSVWHNYVIVCRDRDTVQRQLTEAGVGVGIHYPTIPTEQTCYADMQHYSQATPVAHRLSQSVLSLPMGEYLSDAEVDHVCGALRKLA